MSHFYQRHARTLLWIAAALLPVFYISAEAIPTNNDIETWLPEQSDVRLVYEQFKEQFGAEEVILIGLRDLPIDDPLVEALALRLEQLQGVSDCWTPARLRSTMHELGVDHQQSQERLQGLMLSEGGDLQAVIVALNPTGLQDRRAIVNEIREVVDYCQIETCDRLIAGAPVVVSELDRLGSRKSNTPFFLITLLISACLLYSTLRDAKMTAGIVGLTVWAINATQAIIMSSGGEMNFILSALPVMVMVFTLAIAIHIVHYVQSQWETDDPLGNALRLAWKPCCLATLTTTIGLASLGVSEILPVRQFGYAGALGSVVALIAGLGLTPALITLWPESIRPRTQHSSLFRRWEQIVIDRRVVMASLILLIVGGAAFGLQNIEARLNPLDFLPRDSQVRTDSIAMEDELTNIDTVEAVVDFGTDDLPFVAKLEQVRAIEAKLAAHPAVRHTMSSATFFPDRLPDSSLETIRLLGRAQANGDRGGFVSAGERLWRISARINSPSIAAQQTVYDELREITADDPVTLTGITPLIQGAQQDIFTGFWESFTMAFVIITLVMIVALRSITTALLAMIPNLTPIALVFGILGWFDVPVDIGMMMTASIALGIAVDGTFHYLVHYQQDFRNTGDSVKSARDALRQTGQPILQAALIAAFGMLALTLSSFSPTVRFGSLMAVLLLCAVVGDLVLLPAMLALRPSRRIDDESEDELPGVLMLPQRQHHASAASA